MFANLILLLKKQTRYHEVLDTTEYCIKTISVKS